MMDIKEFIFKINEDSKQYDFIITKIFFLVKVDSISKRMFLILSGVNYEIIKLCRQNPEKMLMYFKDFLNKNYSEHMHLLTNYTLEYGGFYDFNTRIWM